MRLRYNNYICINDDILQRIEVKKSQKRLEFRLDYQNGNNSCSNNINSTQDLKADGVVSLV